MPATSFAESFASPSTRRRGGCVVDLSGLGGPLLAPPQAPRPRLAPGSAEITAAPLKPGDPLLPHPLRSNRQADARLAVSLCHSLSPPVGLGRKQRPAKRVARSAGFAIRSPRGMGDPHDTTASGLVASELTSNMPPGP